jgi:hypothetical protein
VLQQAHAGGGVGCNRCERLSERLTQRPRHLAGRRMSQRLRQLCIRVAQRAFRKRAPGELSAQRLVGRDRLALALRTRSSSSADA